MDPAKRHPIGVGDGGGKGLGVGRGGFATTIGSISGLGVEIGVGKGVGDGVGETGGALFGRAETEIR